uniref:Uncharacterized protein n=1 Tax=Acrobeloides nanus TaxID=290746 RepID=A0A914E530_9BILA
MNTWQNDHIISEPSGVFVKSPDNTTNFEQYGYVKAIAVGCGGCDALRSLPCLSGIFSTPPPITNITVREPVEPIFNESYCERPYKDLAGLVMMQAKYINVLFKDNTAPFVKSIFLL